MWDECYVVIFCNDGDYDHYEEWVDRVFTNLDDAAAYLLEDQGFELISEDTLFFKRRFRHDAPERFFNECSQENGGQSAWIETKPIFIGKEI